MFAWHVYEQNFKPGDGGDKTRWFWCDVDKCPHGFAAERSGCFWWDVRTSSSAPDAGDETSGHLWQQNWVFLGEDVRTFSGCICAGKNATRRSIYRPVYGDKTRYLWWDGKPLQMYLLPTEPDAFHETSGQFQTCLSLTELGIVKT